MRRTDLIRAFANIQKAFEESKIARYLMRSARAEVSSENIVSAFQDYVRHFDKFGEHEIKVLSIFSLLGLEQPKTLTSILGSDKGENDMLRVYFRSINYFTEFFPAITSLLKQDNTDVEEVSTTVNTKSAIELSGRLTVILPESHREISTPERLVKVLESIRLFYEAFAIIEDADVGGLSVAAIDSGSDKSFDFLGAANLMADVRGLIIDLWDRIVFFRERKVAEKLELVSKSLPLLEKINKLEESKKLSREQCEILRRNILDGANKFISAGAVVPEFSDHNNYNPRQLMAPEAKLLVESNSSPFGKNTEPISSFDDLIQEESEDGLSEDEKRTLDALNAKRKNKKG